MDYPDLEFAEMFLSTFTVLLSLIVLIVAGVLCLIRGLRHFCRKRKGLEPIKTPKYKILLNRALVGSTGSVLFPAVFYWSLYLLAREMTSQGYDADDISRVRFAVTAVFGLPLIAVGFVFWVMGLVGIIQVIKRCPQQRKNLKAIISYILEAFVPALILVILIVPLAVKLRDVGLSDMLRRLFVYTFG